DVVPPHGNWPVSRLAHGLDRALFNQTVHWLQDPHSRVFNFPPALQNMPHVTEFAFERLPKFTPSSQDENLQSLAVEHSKQFIGTTSSLTRILAHIYRLLSGDRKVDISTLSMAFASKAKNFTPGLRSPHTFTISRRVHHFDNKTDAPGSEEYMDLNILLWLGTMTEKFLTFSPEKFSRFLRKNPALEEPSKVREAYRYTKSSKFIMRSQLDCQDSRLPGSGVFDLKTRAVLPVRMDRLNIEESSGYLIRSITGFLESFEREYYDLVRSAFLKYNFQARIGGMDGIFVAYHNTVRIFGFQYIPVKEMEERLYGPGAPERGARIFEKCVGIMEALMEEVVACFPGESLSCIINKRRSTDKLFVWVTPGRNFTGQTSIKELVLTVSHLIDGEPVSAERAIDEANGKWNVNYSISRSTRPLGDILKDVWEAQEASEFKDFLPPGVSEEQARHGLAAVDWGAGMGLRFDPEDRVSVKTPDDDADEVLSSSTPAMIRRLRALSRQGKADMLREQQTGTKQVVWGVDHDEGPPAA
ncbi:mitochondrial protein Pet127-domain-containing protein, partial [Hysterangium stoloniferum]